jgi:glycogen debranching enzyme
MVLPLAVIRQDERYIWRGPSLLIVDSTGWAGHGGLSGYYFRQTRFLRALQLRLNGEEPCTCSLAEVAPNRLEGTYIHPEVDRGGGGGSGSGGLARKHGLLYRDIDLCVRYEMRASSLTLDVRLTSRWEDVSGLELAWALTADFASIDEALFTFREQPGEVRAVATENGVTFRYAHPNLPFETRVVGSGARWTWEGETLTSRIDLTRQQTAELRLEVRAVDFQDPIDAEGEARRETKLEAWNAGLASCFAAGETPLIEITNRALNDLGSVALLEGPEEEWLRPGAGVPLYLSFWARDALTAGWQAGLFDRGEMLSQTLTFLSRLQGQVVDSARDEEPGRIINQAKTDPLSRLDAVPFGRYYADFASPFMFIIGLGYLYSLTGSSELVAPHWPAAKRVLAWAREYGDRDGDGYLEYLTQSPLGPRHQGWKDSDNAIVDQAGTQVDPPFAPSEIQGYYYVSLQFMAVLSGVMGEAGEVGALWQEAKALKDRFNRDFWMDDEGFIAFGLDARKRPIRAIGSNGPHCLPTGIVDSDKVPRLVRRMFERDLFSGWGIRTLSSDNPAYNPLDYHLGSVWPVENASMLFGLRRYGFNDRALELAGGLYDLARAWPGGRTPECVGGYGRDEQGHPGAYPKANAPQTWNQTVFPLLVQSLLGLVPCAPLRLLLVDPLLPTWLPEIEVRRLRIGDAVVSLRFQRGKDGQPHFEIIEKDGDLRVVRQPWIESVSATPFERIAALADTLLPF